MASDDDWRAGLAVQRHGDSRAITLQTDAIGAGANLYALSFQRRADRFRDVTVFARDQPVVAFDDGDLCAEAPLHLSELKADVASSDDDEVLRHPLECHHVGIVEIRDIGDPGYIGDARPAPDVQKDLRGIQYPVSDHDRRRAGETCMTSQERQPIHRTKRGFTTFARVARDLECPSRGDLHVEPDGSRHNAKFRTAPGKVHRPRARNQRLGRHATGIDASPTYKFALDQCDCHSRRRQPAGKRRSCLSSSDDHRVELADILSHSDTRHHRHIPASLMF